jgi:hypothetical protein
VLVRAAARTYHAASAEDRTGVMTGENRDAGHRIDVVT